MATSANTTNQLSLLKRLFPKNVAEPLYKRSKFLAEVKKDTNFGGEGIYVNVTIAPTAGGSAEFSEALANQDATQEKRFFVTHKKEYQVFSLQGDVIARSKGDKNAILEQIKQQADKARYAFGRSMAARAWGNAGGSIGRISSTSTVASTTITLTNRADIVRFEPGMWLSVSDDNGTGTSPAGVNTGSNGYKLQVIGRNTATGTVTLSANWDTIGAGTTDYIFRAGDYAQAMTGAQGWGPVTDPSSGESFFNLDRTVGDIQRLSGVRVSGNGASKEETLINAMAEGHLTGAEPKRLYTNPLDFRDLVKELGTKRMIDVDVKEAGIGFRGIEVEGNAGPVVIVSEPDVPQGFAWGLNPEDVYLRTAGECPMMLNEDGVGKLLRAANDDAYQGRIGAYGNFTFENPGHTIIITW